MNIRTSGNDVQAQIEALARHARQEAVIVRRWYGPGTLALDAPALVIWAGGLIGGRIGPNLAWLPAGDHAVSPGESALIAMIA